MPSTRIRPHDPPAATISWPRGRLKGLILEHAASWNLPATVELAANVDAVLDKKELIVTSDSVLIDHCVSWLNLSAIIVQKYIPDAWIVHLADADIK